MPGGHDWIVVPGLEPETMYQFSVLTQNKLGTGPFSEVVTVNTLGEYSHYNTTAASSDKRVLPTVNWNTKAVIHVNQVIFFTS